MYDVACKIQHIPKREDLKKYASLLKQYFEDYGCLVMMGGDVDCGSKGIAGVHVSGNDAYFLVVDPHFVGKASSAEKLIKDGYVKWQNCSDFVDSSFYNLCMPQIKLTKWLKIHHDIDVYLFNSSNCCNYYSKFLLLSWHLKRDYFHKIDELRMSFTGYSFMVLF